MMKGSNPIAPAMACERASGSVRSSESVAMEPELARRGASAEEIDDKAPLLRWHDACQGSGIFIATIAGLIAVSCSGGVVDADRLVETTGDETSFDVEAHPSPEQEESDGDFETGDETELAGQIADEGDSRRRHVGLPHPEYDAWMSDLEHELFTEAQGGELLMPLDRAVLIASGVTSEEDLDRYLRRLDEIFWLFRIETPLMPFDDIQRAMALHEWIQGRIGELYAVLLPKEVPHPQSNLLTTVIDLFFDPRGGTYSCVGITALFNILAQRVGLDVSALGLDDLVEIKHVVSIVHHDGEETYLDASRYGVDLDPSRFEVQRRISIVASLSKERALKECGSGSFDVGIRRLHNVYSLAMDDYLVDLALAICHRDKGRDAETKLVALPEGESYVEHLVDVVGSRHNAEISFNRYRLNRAIAIIEARVGFDAVSPEGIEANPGEPEDWR